jgi:hypothetical protein
MAKNYLYLVNDVRSHMDSLAPFAQALQRRGDRVLMVSTPKNRQTAERNGLPFAEAGESWSENPRVLGKLADLRFRDHDNDAFNRELYTNVMPRQGEAMIPALDRIVDEFQPDGFIHDVSIPGFVANRYGKTPLIIDNGLLPDILDHHHMMVPVLNQMRERLGLPEEPEEQPEGYQNGLWTPAARELFLPGVPNVRGFQLPQRQQEGEIPANVWQSDRPKVYGMMGSTGWNSVEPRFREGIMHAAEMAIRAWSEKDVDAYFAVGPNNREHFEQFAGSNVVVRPLAPQ